MLVSVMFNMLEISVVDGNLAVLFGVVWVVAKTAQTTHQHNRDYKFDCSWYDYGNWVWYCCGSEYAEDGINNYREHRPEMFTQINAGFVCLQLIFTYHCVF